MMGHMELGTGLSTCGFLGVDAAEPTGFDSRHKNNDEMDS